MRPTATPTVCRLRPEHGETVARFFAGIAADTASSTFHPHPFTADQAREICRYQGRDLYLGLFETRAMLGYGLLRGWDAGFDVPSLGICLAPEARGRHLSRVLMQALHDRARLEGARRIRLKVYRDNHVAIRVYRALGYNFEAEEAGQMVGYVELPL